MLLAHRKAIANADGSYTPGVFSVWRPQRIEYIVRGDESPDELNHLARRGFTLIQEVPSEQQSMSEWDSE